MLGVGWREAIQLQTSRVDGPRGHSSGESGRHLGDCRLGQILALDEQLRPLKPPVVSAFLVACLGWWPDEVVQGS